MQKVSLAEISTNGVLEFQERFPPESVSTDISLSQFLSIQEKGVSAWEFIPVDLEQSSSVFVQSRTEITFYDDDVEACVQTNLPIPKQNEVYYWEAKLHDKPETTLISVGLATKPYPSFRLPGICSFHLKGLYQDGTNIP